MVDQPAGRVDPVGVATAAEVDVLVAVAEVEVAEAEVAVVAVLSVFDLKAVNRHEPPHLLYMSPEQDIEQSLVAATDPPCEFPQ
jgi:hypothetical protein